MFCQVLPQYLQKLIVKYVYSEASDNQTEVLVHQRGGSGGGEGEGGRV